MISKNNIFYFKSVESTMDVAKELAEEGCPNFTVVVAERQKHGCGRMGRVWYSDAGGLYFSIIIRPSISIDLSAYISFAVAIDIATTIRDLFEIDTRLKWPNDILVKNRKICGVLSRIETNGNKITYANIGVGLNVNNDPVKFESNAISILDITGKKVSQNKILTTFLTYFSSRLVNFDGVTIMQEWRQLNVTLGKFVKITTPREQINGVASNIDSKGGLEVLLDNGSIKTVVFGDCFHL